MWYFDLGIAYVCAPITYTLQHQQGRQQSPKCNTPLPPFLPSSLSPPSLPLAESLVSLIQSHNTHTRSAGKYTISELQRHPAVGEGVHFLKLWFPSAYKCYRRTEKCTILVSRTRKLFMEGYADEEGFHRHGETAISLPTKWDFQDEVGKEPTRRNGKREGWKWRWRYRRGAKKAVLVPLY